MKFFGKDIGLVEFGELGLIMLSSIIPPSQFLLNNLLYSLLIIRDVVENGNGV
jgi:hypothetical protein